MATSEIVDAILMAATRVSVTRQVPREDPRARRATIENGCYVRQVVCLRMRPFLVDVVSSCEVRDAGHDLASCFEIESDPHEKGKMS